jgi:hypothetical protein
MAKIEGLFLTSKMGERLAIYPSPPGRTLPERARLPSFRILARLRIIFPIHKHLSSNHLASHPPKDVEIRNFFSLFWATPYAILVFTDRERSIYCRLSPLSRSRLPGGTLTVKMRKRFALRDAPLAVPPFSHGIVAFSGWPLNALR